LGCCAGCRDGTRFSHRDSGVGSGSDCGGFGSGVGGGLGGSRADWRRPRLSGWFFGRVMVLWWVFGGDRSPGQGQEDAWESDGDAESETLVGDQPVVVGQIERHVG
jgi:hypothetical protein